VGARFSLLAAGCLACFLLAGSAAGGPPGRWSAVAEGQGLRAATQEIGLARTSDGVLHVAWRQDTGPLSAEVRVRAITRSGELRPTVTAVSGYGLSADPALLAGPASVQLFFAAGTPIEGLLSATAPAAGSPWSAPALVNNQEFAYARTPGVTTAGDGTPLETWYSAGDIVVHRGVSPGQAHTVPSPAGSSNTRPNLATDASGRIWVVWCRFGGSGPVGTIAQQVDPATGAPLGPQVQLPGSSTDFQGSQNAGCVLEAAIARREPVAARVGGGVYAAGASGYPRLTRVLVWRLDASGVTRTLQAASNTSAAHLGHSDPALAAAPDGRIWVAWVERAPGGARIVARRSNREGTVLGAPVSVTPRGGISTAAVNLSAQADRADLIALVQTPANVARIDHTQLLPGLTLVRTGVARRGRRAALVSFRVLDAGEPVRGARVRVGGRTAVTAANGVARLLLQRSPRPRRVAAAATRTGYVGARLTFACC
jgi:hypothetical protein